MLYDLQNSYDVEKFRSRVARLLDTGCCVELKRIFPQRTLDQNKYYQVITEYYASMMGLSKDEVQIDLFKRQLNYDLFKDEKTDFKGNKRITLKSTTALTTKEMALAINRFRNYSAAEAELYIPSGEEYRALFYAQKVIAENNEFMYETKITEE